MTAKRPGCPGMRACLARNLGCGHAARVADWRDIWTAHTLREEVENPGMYDTELAEWRDTNPGVTFREYLIRTRRDAA